MSIAAMEDDNIRLTVNRDENEAQRLDNEWWTLVGQDEMGYYYKIAVDTQTYLELADSLTEEWSIDVIVPRFQIWGTV